MTGDINATVGCEIVELVRRADPPSGFVISDELRSEGDQQLRLVRRQLKALSAAGCPPDRTKGNPIIESISWKVTSDGRTETQVFWVLKCKPGHWRMYFVMSETKRRAIFLYAIAKKTDKRNEKHDLSICVARLKELRAQTQPRLASLAKFVG